MDEQTIEQTTEQPIEQPNKKPTRNYFRKAEYKEMYNDYMQNNLSLDEVAKKYGYAKGTSIGNAFRVDGFALREPHRRIKRVESDQHNVPDAT